MLSLRASVLLCICYAGLGHSHAVPLIINTWPFLTATTEAWKTLTAPNPQRTAALDAVEKVHQKLMPLALMPHLILLSHSLGEQHAVCS